MDHIQEKREFIVNEIMRELDKKPIRLNFSSPAIKGARLFIVMNDEPASVPDAEPEDALPFPVTGPQEAHSISPLAEDVSSDYAYEEEEEELSPKELAKLEKAQEKERKRNEKAYSKMRKDIQKRGFDTGVLKKFDDPADIYALSDEDIRQIEVAGVINEDGYYTFTYPDDFGNIEKRKIQKSTVLLISGFALAVLILIVILINNLMTFF